MESDIGKLFEGYSRLQGETYEFISRSIATHNWLEEAYRVVKAHPELSGEALYRACRPAFDRVYVHLFSPLLRSYRMMAFPFAESLAAQLSSRAGGLRPVPFADQVAAMTQWQMAYFQSVTGMFQQMLQFGASPSDGDRQPMDGVSEVVPFRLLTQASDRQTDAYFGLLNQWLASLGENQFVFPKPLVVNLQKAVSIYPRLQTAATGYETMLYDAWEDSMKRFTAEAEKDRGLPEFKDFFEACRTSLTAEFGTLLRRSDFIKAQTDFVETFSDFIAAAKGAGEAQMAMFPALPIATTAQMESVAQRLHSYKKRLDSVERRLRVASSDETDVLRIEKLERRITELEARLTARDQRVKRATKKSKSGAPLADTTSGEKAP